MKRYIYFLFISILVLFITVPKNSYALSGEEFSKLMDQYLSDEKNQEKLGKVIENYFRQLQARARKEQAKRAEAEMERQFKNPVKVPIGKSPIRGTKTAKVTIIEFSDFQCPFCGRASKTMEQVLKAYPNDVRLVYKHFPLDFHPEAMPAAKASVAAQNQGKFWEFHDALFQNQGKLSKEFYLATAKKLGLNIEKFKKDMNSKETEARIKAEAALGSKLGIQGTPGFFVNGVAVKGAYPFNHFKKIIDRWLKEKG